MSIKKSPEEAQKEMVELSKIELQKLAETIAKNPELLKPKFMDSDSETDSDYMSDSDSNASSVTSYHNKSLTVYKKELEIDKLQEKNHYKTLELSNLIYENSKLKQEVKEVKNLYDESIKFIEFIKKIIQLKDKTIFSDDNINFSEDIKIVSVKMLNIQKEYDTASQEIIILKNLVDSQENLIKNYFGKELKLIETNIENIYQKNFNLLNKKLQEINTNKKIDYLLLMMVIVYICYLIYKNAIPVNIEYIMEFLCKHAKLIGIL